MPDADVPDLIGALAERFKQREMPTREALHLTLCMLVDAMDASEEDIAACFDGTETIH